MAGEGVEVWSGRCVCVCVCEVGDDCVDLKEVAVSGCVQQCEGIKPLDTAHTSVHCNS